MNEEDAKSSQSEDVENGETLVARRVRRVLMNARQESVQRKSFFQTRCKCKGKVCNVIIDGGSSNNLVLEEMVSKLQLERRRHPHPYQIAWLQDVQKVLVSEQCLVKFNIVDYHDEALCDIMSMTVCHMLLGRPWQFDRKAMHDGYANTYTVMKNGV